MTIEDIAGLRLLNQHIAVQYETPLAIAQHMGAMQAQDYYGSLWALGLRTGLNERSVIASIERREIIRTWPQRATLHFVPAEDAAWMVGLSAERMLRGARRRHEGLELTNEIFAKSKEILTEVLRGGQYLTRSQVMDALEQQGISTKNGRGYHILWHLSQSGITYVGPMKDKQQTFGLLAELVTNPPKYTRAEALAELAKRYFISHGPATLQDFMWWASLTAADAKTGIEANKATLHTEIVEGKTYWLSGKTTYEDALEKAFLLPGFDEYMLGYKDRSAALHIDHAPKVVPGGNGMFLSTIVVRGRIVGTWKRMIKKDHVVLEFAPFTKLTKADLILLQTPAEAYGAFLSLPPKITLT